MLGEGGENKKMAKVLIVDDREKNIDLLESLCETLNHDTIVARNGREAIEKARLESPDIILMDVMMPEMDGLEATEKLKSDEQTKFIPVIIVTALDSKDDKIRGISVGADDILSKPIDSWELSLRMRNSLRIKEYQDFLKDHNAFLEKKVDEKTEELKNAYEKNRQSYIETIFRLNLAAEYKDEDTGAHLKRIGLFSKELAGTLGMNCEFSNAIYYSSPMHDIGKVGVPDSILLKPGKLTTEEVKIMKEHTTIGAKILENSESPFLKMAEEIALTHHERWNGKGYPNALKGEDIPLSGRIVNIVDQYDALRSKRPYKTALSHETVMKIITEGDGRTSPQDFDPEVLDAFGKSEKKFEEIYESSEDK